MVKHKHGPYFFRNVPQGKKRNIHIISNVTTVVESYVLSLEKAMATHSNILAWKSHGQKILVGYSPWGHKELDMTERLNRRRWWHPPPVLLPGESQGQRSLVGYSLWGRWESDTTERLHFHFSLSCIGEGNGSPLQCSCLENPRGGGAWWAAVYGVAQSQTRLKRLSSSSSRVTR